MTQVPATYKGETDEQLAVQAQGGDLASFEELVRRYQVPLLRFLQTRCPRSQEAEDLLQDVFLRAYRSINLYQDRWPFRTWIFTLTYRLAVSAGRRKQLVSQSPYPEKLAATPADQAQPWQQAGRREVDQQLWSLARYVLSEEQFTAIWMYYIEEIPATDIAKALGQSWGSVKTMLHRARKKLLLALQQEYPQHHAAMMESGGRL